MSSLRQIGIHGIIQMNANPNGRKRLLPMHWYKNVLLAHQVPSLPVSDLIPVVYIHYYLSKKIFFLFIMQPLDEFWNTWQYLIAMIDHTIHITDESFFSLKSIMDFIMFICALPFLFLQNTPYSFHNKIKRYFLQIFSYYIIHT